jgi:hypothetical protein
VGKLALGYAMLVHLFENAAGEGIGVGMKQVCLHAVVGGKPCLMLQNLRISELIFSASAPVVSPPCCPACQHWVTSGQQADGRRDAAEEGNTRSIWCQAGHV